MEAMTISPVPRATEPLRDPAALPRGEEGGIVRAASRGDVRAFEQIVHAHHPRVLNFLHQMTRQRQDAEDLTQQTFMKAFQHIDRVDSERPIINWLLTIARRTALNHFRSVKKWDFVPAEIAASEPSPARLLEQQDRAENLWARARRVLSQREFTVLWLRFAEDLSIEETARVTGLTRIHVKVIVHRARHHLQKGEPNA